MRALAHLALVLFTLGACRSTPPESDSIARAERFRALKTAGDYEAARRMMAADPRRWWEVREGEGSPWTIGERGRWADWDEHMRSQSEELEWAAEPGAVTLLVSEINDYYRLLERGPQQVRYTYFFDEAGVLEGFMIAAAGERDPGRADEYLEWAAEHETEELSYLRPGGKIDPTGDRAERTRAQINRWRASVGLAAIEG